MEGGPQGWPYRFNPNSGEVEPQWFVQQRGRPWKRLGRHLQERWRRKEVSKVENEAMDLAAQEAREELKKLDPAAVATVGSWWWRWYRRAGHKRLARALLAEVSEGE